MRKFILSTAAAALIAGLPAHAKPANDLSLPAAQPVKITVSLSKDLAHRADNLPKDRRDRGQSRGLNDGWSGNGFYGMRDLDHLKTRVSKELMKDLEREDIQVSDTAPYELRVTLVDAKPTRPTFKQLGKQSGLSYQSRANGGAKLTAQLVDGSGTVIGETEYDWYEIWFDQNFGAGTWSDAGRAINRFSRLTAKDLAN